MRGKRCCVQCMASLRWSCLAPVRATRPRNSGRRRWRLYIPSGIGGGYDTYARLASRHLGRFLPGNPTIVPRNMPGAGGVVLANYLYNVAPKDGSAIALFMAGAPLEPLFGNTAGEVRHAANSTGSSASIGSSVSASSGTPRRRARLSDSLSAAISGRLVGRRRFLDRDLSATCSTCWPARSSRSSRATRATVKACSPWSAARSKASSATS